MVGFNFTIQESKLIKGIWIIKPSFSEDNRGKIWTSFLKNELENLLPKELYFKHDKFSYSKKNVLRGIHGDEKSWKLVTCVFGSIQQVVVDCGKESNTYTKYESFNINNMPAGWENYGDTGNVRGERKVVNPAADSTSTIYMVGAGALILVLVLNG